MIFLLAVVAAQWFTSRMPSAGSVDEAEDDWVVLPVSAEAKEAGIRPAAKPAVDAALGRAGPAGIDQQAHGFVWG